MRKRKGVEGEPRRVWKEKDKWLEEINYGVYASRLIGGHANFVLLTPCYTLARSCHRFPHDKKYRSNLYICLFNHFSPPFLLVP